MTDFDDQIGVMVTDLLIEAGDPYTYTRGTTSASITLAKSEMPSQWVDQGDGSIVEVRPINFKALTSTLPYAKPMQGDRITGGGKVYELHPTTSEKVYRQLSPQLTRLHAKRIR
jgi:hypothetical protein|tara:strand:- start:1098 stop:1439 length:342 start_codon:yes stop_codon:yes gene_type:complete